MCVIVRVCACAHVRLYALLLDCLFVSWFLLVCEDVSTFRGDGEKPYFGVRQESHPTLCTDLDK